MFALKDLCSLTMFKARPCPEAHGSQVLTAQESCEPLANLKIKARWEAVG